MVGLLNYGFYQALEPLRSFAKTLNRDALTSVPWTLCYASSKRCELRHAHLDKRATRSSITRGRRLSISPQVNNYKINISLMYYVQVSNRRT